MDEYGITFGTLITIAEFERARIFEWAAANSIDPPLRHVHLESGDPSRGRVWRNAGWEAVRDFDPPYPDDLIFRIDPGSPG